MIGHKLRVAEDNSAAVDLPSDAFASDGIKVGRFVDRGAALERGCDDRGRQRMFA